jgi:hypothetical protein
MQYLFAKDIVIKRSLFGRSLCSVRQLQSVVGSKASFLHSAGTTQHDKNSSLKNSSYSYCAASFLIFTRSLPFVRQGYYMHNTASFRFTPQATLHCIPAVLCLSPFIFSAVALLAQLSELAPLTLCSKSRNTKDCLMFFFIVSHSQ